MSWMNLLILVIVAVALALPGVFLVLRNMAMVADAISHTVLLGIIVGYFFVPDMQSPFLILMAALVGLLTVCCIELLVQKGLLKSDAATGIIFPSFFALGVILLSRYFSNIHLDLDAVIMGDITFADFNLISIGPWFLPKSLVYGSAILVINCLFLSIFYKELKLSCFDIEQFLLAGFSQALIGYSLITLLSLSAVVSFEIVGAILVVSFLVTPAASALLLARHLHITLLLTVIYALFNSVVGYFLSIAFNVSSSGMCAFVAGVSFLITLLATRIKKILRLKRVSQQS